MKLSRWSRLLKWLRTRKRDFSFGAIILLLGGVILSSIVSKCTDNSATSSQADDILNGTAMLQESMADVTQRVANMEEAFKIMQEMSMSNQSAVAGSSQANMEALGENENEESSDHRFPKYIAVNDLLIDVEAIESTYNGVWTVLFANGDRIEPVPRTDFSPYATIDWSTTRLIELSENRVRFLTPRIEIHNGGTQIGSSRVGWERKSRDKLQVILQWENPDFVFESHVLAWEGNQAIIVMGALPVKITPDNPIPRGMPIISGSTPQSYVSPQNRP